MSDLESTNPFVIPSADQDLFADHFELYGITSGMTRTEVIESLDLPGAAHRAQRYATEDDIRSMINEWLRTGVPTEFISRLEHKKPASLVVRFNDEERLWKLKIRYWRPHSDSGLLDRAFREALVEAFPQGQVGQDEVDGISYWTVTFVDRLLERASIDRLKSVYLDAIIEDAHEEPPWGGDGH